MERSVDRGIASFTEFVNALMTAAPSADVRWRHPLSVKTQKIAPDQAKASRTSASSSTSASARSCSSASRAPTK